MKILCLHGPNLNMLGKRDPLHYGNMTLEMLCNKISNTFEQVDFTFYQSNHEGDLIDLIQNANEYDALLINAGAYTHTSIAIRDALEIVLIPKAEAHLSDIQNREEFRKINYLKDVLDGSFYGKKEESYFEAIRFLLSRLEK
ncbi:3-dehydroquinate dehydratase [Alteracholeplasma palmae J233]|uniref:3-dehydroquinate dehydratase n=1 Tax=Alteracholeplasma palmae (strain ATCC 49389 / J233) TaxID=1318466 RepID=U4KPT5_ALTPJ|nr:type II 3-dehydroquinate dehydratase [Alteracholeplasma palmae]CCV64300.1 3-dehydroquinate dehydratase [Alteracholeplasma palmae J233]